MKAGSGAAGILLSVHCDDPDWAKRARNILHQTGGEDVASTGEARADFATYGQAYAPQ